MVAVGQTDDDPKSWVPMLLQHRFVSMVGEYQRTKIQMIRQTYRCQIMEKSVSKWRSKYSDSQKKLEELQTEMIFNNSMLGQRKY